MIIVFYVIFSVCQSQECSCEFYVPLKFQRLFWRVIITFTKYCIIQAVMNQKYDIIWYRLQLFLNTGYCLLTVLFVLLIWKCLITYAQSIATCQPICTPCLDMHTSKQKSSSSLVLASIFGVTDPIAETILSGKCLLLYIFSKYTMLLNSPPKNVVVSYLGFLVAMQLALLFRSTYLEI